VESDEHVDFHSSESSGDVNSLIALLGAPKQNEGKQVLKHSIVDKSPKKQEEEAPRVGRSSKEVDTFHVFMVQQREAIT
jgi:hypothetical protein